MCVFAFKQVIDYYRSHNSPVFICYIDASKAFDRINYWILFKKLLKRGFPVFVVRFLSYWYSYQTFKVRWGSVLSPPFFVSNGVRQGGVLSPNFVNVYIDDLCVKLNNSKIGCSINGISCNNFAHADDMAILAPCISALQKLLNICHEYAVEHDIIYNDKKSFVMCVKPRSYKLRLPNVFLNGKKMIYVDSIKYLGYIVDSQLRNDCDLKRQLRSIYCKSNMLIRKFYSCSYEVKTTLYRSYCSNFYCTPLWWRYPNDLLCKLKVAFNNGLRKLLNLNKYCSASYIC